jgi:hypothetical protein
MAPTMKTTLKTIASNFGIATVSACVSKTQHPDGESDAAQWDANLLALLQTISTKESATIKDFRAKLRSAIKSRQERNKTVKGKVKWMTIPDLKAVLKLYEQEEKDAQKQETPPPPKRSTKRATTVPATPSSQILPNPPKNLSQVNSLTPYQNSSAPVAFAGYTYLSNVKPQPVNLNPDASSAAKPRGRKRGKPAAEDELAARPSKRPSIRQEDEDPRGVDDTGFISAANTATRPKRAKKRLSRLEQSRMRIPHWQMGMQEDGPDVPEETQDETLANETEETPEVQEYTLEDLIQNGFPAHFSDPPNIDLHPSNPNLEAENVNDAVSISMDSVDLNALKIPDRASTKERLEFHRMRRRIWYDDYMVRMLRVQLRGEENTQERNGGVVAGEKPRWIGISLRGNGEGVNI